MKSKTTILWFMLATALATAIWVLNTYFQARSADEKRLFSGLRPDRISSIQVIPAGAREISVTRTNQTWLIDKPFVYPAQAAAVDGLVAALQKLSPSLTLSAGEMSARKDADAEFGFDNPQFTLDLEASDRTWHLRVGNKTATGDGVYVRIVGATGAFVTDTAWLQFLPHNANDWRDTTLADVPGTTDWLVITNGPQAIELRRDATNRLWRLVRPLPARANNLQIALALGQLQSAHISNFVSDDPKADLATYGLEPATVDVWLGTGTNLLSGIHGGKEVPGMAGEIFARRDGWNSVVTTPKDSLAAWRVPVNEFRDPNLVELTAPVEAIEMRGLNNFTLQHGTNGWTMVGEKYQVDGLLITNLIKTLANLTVTNFVADSVTPADLQTYGLTNPVQQITLLAAPNDTNKTIVKLLFGGVTNSQIYVKRTDEESVYSTPLAGVARVFWKGDDKGDYYRAPQVWNFSETNVARVILHQSGRERELVRNGTNDWSLAKGSGIIEPLPVEETIHRLGDLKAEAWFGRQFEDAQAGVSTNSLAITIDLKTGEKYSLQFGQRLQLGEDTSSLAVVTLGGERWAFIFPRVLLPYVAEYLTVPQTP